MTSSNNRRYKAFEELTYRDDFMFGCVIQDKIRFMMPKCRI